MRRRRWFVPDERFCRGELKANGVGLVVALALVFAPDDCGRWLSWPGERWDGDGGLIALAPADADYGLAETDGVGLLGWGVVGGLRVGGIVWVRWILWVRLIRGGVGVGVSRGSWVRRWRGGRCRGRGRLDHGSG